MDVWAKSADEVFSDEFFAKLPFGDFKGGGRGGVFGLAYGEKTAEAAKLSEEFARKGDGVFAANAATKQYRDELGI